jgi:Fibronectin type III domain
MSSSGKRVRTTVARQRSGLLRGLSASLAVTMTAGAALLAASVGAATVANAAAPGTLTCNTGGNGAGFASTWNDTNTFTLSPASVQQGDTETVTWTSATGLVNGSPVALGAGTTQVQVVVKLTGAMSGNVVATTTAGAYPAVTTASESPLGPITATGTFTTTGSGTLNATVSFIDFNSNSVDTYCSASTANTQFPAAGSALVSYINTPGFQTPPGLPTPGDAGSFATNNVNYGDLQVSAGATAFGSATATITGPPQHPAAPTGVTAAPGDGQVTVSWTAPADGGSPITGYTVTSDPDTQVCTTTTELSCVVTGLTNGTAYTFTVVATNTVGDSDASDPSDLVTPSAPTAPAAPTGVTAAEGDGKVTVSWTAPADGGSSITGYTVTSDPGDKTCTTDGDLSCVVTGLDNGTAYTFTVIATNTVGDSDPSDASNPVTPLATTIPPPASLNCNTGSNAPAFATTYDDTMTYSLSPTSATAGDTVTATYTGATGIGNAAPVTLYQGTVQVQAVIALSGAMSGTVVAVTTPGSYPAADIPSTDTPTPTGPYSASTTFTASGSGTVTATVSELILKGGLDTYCSPAAGNYPGSSAPTIVSTLLKGYTPNWQTNTASITYNNGQNSCTATAIASKTLTTSGGTTSTATAAPTCVTPSTPPPSTTTSESPISANVPSTVTKQVSGIYCQIFTSQNGILWNGPADPQNSASKSVAAPYFTVALTPQVPKAGETVTITVKYNVGNGAGPTDIPANADKLRGVVQLSGSLTKQVIVSSTTLPAFAGSQTNPNSRVPSLPMTGTFTFPSTPNAVVYASLLTTADDDGNPANVGNTNGTPTKPDTFNWPKVTDLYDVVCNKSLTAKLHPLTPTSGLTAADSLVQPLAVAAGTVPSGAIGVTAGVPYYGTLSTTTTTTSTAESGDTLPHTGASGVVGAGVVAAIVIQLGLILYVRSVRAVPVRRPSHA